MTTTARGLITLTDIADGGSGVSSAIVSLYKKSLLNTGPGPLPNPSGTFTYNFTSMTLSGGIQNGWSTSIPTITTGEFVWITQAAVSSTDPSASFPSTNFSTSVPVLGQGIDGLKTAIVYLYRTSSIAGSAPANPSGTFTYDFSTAAITGGTLNGWSTVMLDVNQGNKLWVKQAVASSSTNTDTILATEFSPAVVTSVAGTNGERGIASGTSYPLTPTDGEVFLKLPEGIFYRWSSATSAWVDEVYSKILDGSLNTNKFALGLEPVSIHVGVALPTVKTTENLSWEGKLYRWSGTAYVSTVPAGDITGELVANQIAANAITTSKIQAGAITVDQLAAGSVTTSKLVVADFTNLVHNDWSGGSTSGWILGQPASVAIVDGTLDATMIAAGISGFYLQTTDSQSYIVSKETPVEPGAQYHINGWLFRSAGLVPGTGLQLRWTNQDGSASYSTLSSIENEAWVYLSGIFTAPGNAKSVAYWIRPLFSAGTGQVLLAKPTLRRAVSSSLLVDGTITSNKLNTASLGVSGLAVFGGTLNSPNFVAGTSGWQINNTGDAEINSLVVRRNMIAGGALTNDIQVFKATSVTVPTNSGIYAPAAQPPAWPSTAYFDLGFQNYVVPADAPEKVQVNIEPKLSLSYQEITGAPASSAMLHWGMYIRMETAAGVLRSAFAYDLMRQFSYTGFALFLSVANTNGVTLPILIRGVDYNANETIVFRYYFYRYRQVTNYGVGVVSVGSTLNVKEYFR